MPKLGVFSGDELCRILEQHGFLSVRQRGSHVVMQRP
jgi:predicted RNA binding protein YcfA (HicA-like mRNA interferase family)